MKTSGKYRGFFLHLMLMGIPLYLIFEFISLVVSFAIYFQKPIPTYLKVFPPFLLVTFIVELIGLQLMRKGMNSSFLYNPFTVFEVLAYLLALYYIIHNRRAKKIVWFSLWLFGILALINIYFIQVHTFPSYSYSLGCLFIVGFTIYYFLEIFQLPKAVSLMREPPFWICSGLLFFYCCSFPLFGLTNFNFAASSVILRNLSLILTIMNVMLYSLFSIAFLCRIKWRKPMVNQQVS